MTLLFIFLIGADLVVKIMALRLGLPYQRNYGVAFGMFPESFFSSWIFHLIIILLCVFYMSYQLKIRDRLSTFFVIFLSGAVSNIVTRAWLGYVLDIASFNLADVYLIAGLLGIIYEEFRKQGNRTHLGR